MTLVCLFQPLAAKLDKTHIYLATNAQKERWKGEKGQKLTDAELQQKVPSWGSPTTLNLNYNHQFGEKQTKKKSNHHKRKHGIMQNFTGTSTNAMFFSQIKVKFSFSATFQVTGVKQRFTPLSEMEDL